MFFIQSFWLFYLWISLAKSQRVIILPAVRPILPPDELEFRQIRIQVEYVGQKLEHTNQYILENVIMREVVQRIQMIVKVNGPKRIPPFDSTVCDDKLKVPKKFHTQFTDTDLILFVQDQPRDRDFLAFASACNINTYNRRPDIGLITINNGNIDFKGLNLKNTSATFLHELLHVLAFSPALYEHYDTENQIIRIKDDVKELISPNVLEVARQHFNCPTLNAVPLENEGDLESSGSHFEKLFLANEIMTPQLTGDSVYTKFSQALLKDTGWYEVTDELLQNFTYGEGKGCEFIEQFCNGDFEEFCEIPEKIDCSLDHTDKTVCRATQFSNGCLTKEQVTSLNCNVNTKEKFVQTSLYETQGENARCFRTVDFLDNRRSGCFRSRCEDNRIIFLVDNTEFICLEGQTSIKYREIEVFCPDVQRFCEEETKLCPNDCSGNGICLQDYTCKCIYPFKGESCNEVDECPEELQSFCGQQFHYEFS